jgi:Plavaka transposase
VVGSEVCEVYYRDVIECVKTLFGDPTFTPYLQFAPEKHYTDDTKDVRVYHDMYTGKWWWRTQVRPCFPLWRFRAEFNLRTQEVLEKEDPGGTIIPVLLSTDKTQLTTFRNKCAYPLYMSIGNIPKEIRRKPSLRAYVLLAYLPTTRLEHVSNKAQRRRLLSNLYHSCMHKILQPLVTAGKAGVYMACGDGNLHRNHPILASFIGDYPEQILSTGTVTGECPTCDVDHDRLGDYNQDTSLRDLASILEVISTFDRDPAGFLRACSAAGIKPIVNPFWKDLPYAHIFRSITPDILHQIYQGLIKHIFVWIIEAVGPEEVDARCRRLPPNHSLRSFTKGISSLSRVTGQEHDQMCRILLTLVMDAPLVEGSSSQMLVRAVRALMDFAFLAQYPAHTGDTLELLEDALSRFHDNKQIFVDLGIRDHFNLPKLHFTRHYVDLIKLYGTTDNFNTEYTERLHIDLAKAAYAATNLKDEFSQMTTWLERQEKIRRHDHFVKWRLSGSPPIICVHDGWQPPGLELDRKLQMTIHPSARSVSLETFETDYGAQHFRAALRRYVVLLNAPHTSAAQVERRLWDIHLPFRHLPVWHRIKYLRTDIYTGVTLTADTIHAHPWKFDTRGHHVPGRFDTALINEGTGGDTGILGMSSLRA